jgi:molybdate transport system substrate-binding protein
MMPLRVLSAGAMRRIVGELAEAFQRETGHAVLLTTGTVGALTERATAGEPADVFVLADAAIEALVEQGVVLPGTRVDLARTGVGIGVKRGAPLPDVSTPEALRDTLLRVASFVYIDPAHGGTSGIHFADVLRQLGIADAVRDKTLLWPGGSAADAVVRGQAEIVVHQISEILPSRESRSSAPSPRPSRRPRPTRRGSPPGPRHPSRPAA